LPRERVDWPLVACRLREELADVSLLLALEPW